MGDWKINAILSKNISSNEKIQHLKHYLGELEKLEQQKKFQVCVR